MNTQPTIYGGQRRYVFVPLLLTVLAVASAATAQTFTLECATISRGGGVLPDGSILVVGQPLVGTIVNGQFTIDLGMIPCLADSDGDGVLDVADVCPGFDDNIDTDGDGAPDGCDNCPLTPNAAQVDTDDDQAGDLCDICPADALDACIAGGSTAEEIPADDGGSVETPDGGLTIDIDPGDLSGDVTISVTQTVTQDPEVDLTVGPNPALGQAVAMYDLEPDGIVFDTPVTLTVVADVTGLNQDQRDRLKLYIFSDTDGDEVADAFVEVSGTACSILAGPPDIATCTAEVSHFSTYALLAPLDTDDDGVPDLFPPDADNCPQLSNPDQSDLDGDGLGDLCDDDDDNDGIPDGSDVCAGFDDGLDFDVDGVPDGCDVCSGSDDNTDSDTDGVPDGCDLCPGFDDNADADGDGIPDGCDIDGCGTLLVRTDKHVVGSGDHPGSTKEGIEGMDVCAFDKSAGSCAAGFGVSWQNYPDIFATCDIVECGTTDVDGSVSLILPAGDYIVIGQYDPDGFPPNDDGDELHIGVSASDFACSEDGNPDTISMQKYLQVIEKANGKKVPAKYTRLTGSELLIIEPEYVLWDETDQLYPFVFETIGDWSITASVAPPEGFVSDYDALSAEVDNELAAVQFTITEVGSDLVPTETTFEVSHNGRSQIVHGEVGILLTPDYAASRGFDVAMLRAQGLIKERPGNQGQGKGQGQVQGQGDPPGGP